MLLSDRDIRDARVAGQLHIDRWEDELLQPSSVDVRLDRWFRVPRPTELGYVDPKVPQPEMWAEPVSPQQGEPFILFPGQFALAQTWEVVTLGLRLAARVEGKSSLGRLGYRVHSTAGFVDPGFHGRITLELSNDSPYPIAWWPGMKVGQLCVFRLSSPVERPYGYGVLGSHYGGQMMPEPSRMHLGWRDWSAEVYGVD
jgi:dCTP deaminase